MCLHLPVAKVALTSTQTATLPLSDIQITISHRAQGDYDELKHPSFFEVVGDVDAVRALARLDSEREAAAQSTATPAQSQAFTTHVHPRTAADGDSDDVEVVLSDSGDDAQQAGVGALQYPAAKRRRTDVIPGAAQPNFDAVDEVVTVED